MVLGIDMQQSNFYKKNYTKSNLRKKRMSLFISYLIDFSEYVLHDQKHYVRSR